MVLLQHKLSVKLSQRQILTPGLVQMVSVLALNKLELKDMINAEMVENPVLEELEESVPSARRSRQERRRPRPRSPQPPPKKIPSPPPKRKIRSKKLISDRSFRTISIPVIALTAKWKKSSGHRSRTSSPSRRNLTDHLAWQLGALSLRPEVREAADLIIGNLNEDGYLIASDEEMLGVAPPAPPEADAADCQETSSVRRKRWAWIHPLPAMQSRKMKIL